MSQPEAGENAARRLTPAGPSARGLERLSTPLRGLLALASLVTIAVALWLFTVIARVLPAHDPSRIPLWTGVAIGFLVYGGLCLAYLLSGARHAPLRAVVLLLSVAAIGLGLYGVTRLIPATSAGRQFEGYLLLLGFILIGHGTVALADTVISAVIARRVDLVAALRED